ncbi:MAG: hypothetical protein JJU32_14180 [Phormidium sp. BM_Day4_Bin.17]|nr:hypothetical protein [Phormidium sp. BM_Day4_Bin.17]UCJ13231.1 MAG: hypothetical protein JWS08_05480 [Phormidium sp. PBR-2020]
MKSAPECPRCGKYSIVKQTDSRWTCLNCGFSKNLSHRHSQHNHDSDADHEDGGWFGIFVLAGILLVVMVEVAYSQDSLQQHREELISAIPLEQL